MARNLVRALKLAGHEVEGVGEALGAHRAAGTQARRLGGEHLAGLDEEPVDVVQGQVAARGTENPGEVGGALDQRGEVTYGRHANVSEP